MTIEIVSYVVHDHHHVITCIYNDFLFEITVTCAPQETVVSSFRHGDFTASQVCPFCHASISHAWCAGILQNKPRVYDLLRNVFHHPACRLPLLTETQLNFDEPVIKFWVDASQDPNAYYSVEELRQHVAEIEEMAIEKHVRLLYIRPDFQLFVAEREQETMYFSKHHPSEEWEMQPIERWQIVGIPGVYTLSFPLVLRLFLSNPQIAVQN